MSVADRRPKAAKIKCEMCPNPADVAGARICLLCAHYLASKEQAAETDEPACECFHCHARRNPR